jgi:Cu(I)/Ag(I) efflux system membrane protein CusA/SilA
LQETLANIEQLIASEILLVLLVLLLFSVNVRTALMTGAIVPIAIALTFVAMKLFGVKADMIALLGISIAIGLIADMGIVLSDELARVIANMKEEEQVKDTVWRAVSRQGGLLCTMGCATIIGFLPALALQSSANPLFRPLIFAVVIALLVGLFSALVFLPSIALLVYRAQKASSVKRNFFQKVWRHFTNVALLTIGLILAILIWGWLGLFVALIAVYRWAIWVLPDWWKKIAPVASKIINWLGSAMLFAYLAHHWRPLGPDYGLISNLFYTLLLVSLVLGGFELLRRKYEKLLRLVLAHRILFLLIPAFLILYGFQIGIGFEKLHAWIYPIFARSAPSTNSQTKPPSSRPQPRPQPRQDQAQIGKPPPPETAPARPTTMPEHTDNTTDIASTQPTTFPHKDAQTAEPTGSPPLLQGPSWLSWSYWRSIFSLQRREFSPKFDQGLLALRLVTRPDSTAVQALASYRKLEQDLRSIPEISHIISKIGRSESRLDPALAWDVEVLLRYQGKFAHDPKTGRIIRQWRQQIRSAEDIREEIAERSEKLGLRLIEQGPQVDVPMFFQYFGTTAQPSIRLTGMDRAQLKAAAAQIAQILNRAESLGIAVISDAGIQDKPLITIDVKLNAMAGYGLQLEDLQLAIQMASEGKLVATLSHTAKPYQVFARYHIQKFGHIDQIKRLPIFNADGHKIELHRVADIAYLQTPMSIVSEDARPVVYLRLERRVGTRTLPHLAILTQYLDDHKQAGILQIPKGIDYQFVGFGQAQDETSLMLVMCLSLLLIFIILYLHFRSVPVIGFILIGVAIAYSGGVSIIWLYQQPWFNNFALFNLHIRDILNVSPLYLNHATWLGLVALLGLAASNGVMIAHHLQQQFATTKREDTDEPPALPSGNSEISEQIVQVCLQHIRPYLGITATTLCALLPILVSNRPNSEFMLAVAAPIFGGMLTGLLSLFVIPVFYCWKTERHFAQLKRQEQKRKRKFWWPF